jgi:hypothetical protein
MLLQLAAQDIGQLTDIEPRRAFLGHSPARLLSSPGGRRFCAGRLVYIDKASVPLASARASWGSR